MSLPELCIRRPVMTTLMMVALLIFGIIGYRTLPVSELPAVDFPTISVSASLPGASPETMAAAVATPLEGQFSTIAGLDSMTSTSAQGSATITLQFALDRNIDAAAQDVQSAIAAALRKLPPNMPAPPSFRKVNPADSPISTSRCRRRPCRCRWSMNTPKPSWRNGCRRFPGLPRCRSTVRRNTPSASRPTRTSWRHAASASTNCNRPSPRATSTSRSASSTAAARPSR
jgi:hypothetical protein